jgi:elongation factor G
VVADLTSRRGIVVGAEVTGPEARIEGEVPLAETFGYATALRSLTQGQGTFSLEFTRYRRLPPGLEKDVIAERKRDSLAGAT